MDKLERKIPPVALFVIFVILMTVIDKVWVVFRFEFPLNLFVAVAAVGLSGVIGLAGVYEFRKAKTTVNPINVEAASTVVDSGIFAYTRNPMYLALMILLVGLGYWQQNILCLLLSYGFVMYLNRFQIRPEEKALENNFGPEYLDYKQRVRRWI